MSNSACDKNYKNVVNSPPPKSEVVKFQPAKSNAFTRLLIFMVFVC